LAGAIAFSDLITEIVRKQSENEILNFYRFEAEGKDIMKIIHGDKNKQLFF
jgi:predicted CopG family antitoxin